MRYEKVSELADNAAGAIAEAYIGGMAQGGREKTIANDRTAGIRESWHRFDQASATRRTIRTKELLSIGANVPS